MTVHKTKISTKAKTKIPAPTLKAQVNSLKTEKIKPELGTELK